MGSESNNWFIFNLITQYLMSLLKILPNMFYKRICCVMPWLLIF